MAETSSLLNCRTRKGTAGSNPASSTSLSLITSLLRGYIFGEWRSPVAHLVWDQRVAGSNPVSPT